MKTFTEQEVDALIRVTITETSNGIFEWLKAETDVVDKDTKKVIVNSEIDKRENAKKISEYIYPRLAGKGIKITTNQSENKS